MVKQNLNLSEQALTANIWEEEISLERNEYLRNQGDIDRSVYLITEGCLRVFVIDELEEHSIRFAYQGNITAALDSHFTGQPTDIFIQALRKTKVKKASYQSFMTWIDSNAALKDTWMETLKALVLQQMERERDLLCASPLTRYNRVLKRSPQLFQEVPAKYIANYLRMTPETLSRLQKS
ncbi:MAG: Crp/Fnr family transcriptional regulator [Luteibaculum sp.]